MPPDRPAGAAPERPAGAAPERPAGAAPERPAGAAPERPAGTAPERPAGAAPDRPAGAAPDRPAGTALTPASAPDAAAAERLIVALDFSALADATRLVDRLVPAVSRFKIGLELFAAAGPAAVTEIRRRGGRVFVDLKLHDIPETVRRAAQVVAESGADLLTVHTAGGSAMMAAAVAGAKSGGTARVLAVTVLTSMDLADLAAAGTSAASIEELVLRRARLAHSAGCHGVIASPQEARAIRQAIGPAFLIITPGVRPQPPGAAPPRTAAAAAPHATAPAESGTERAGAAARDDQKRTGSARQAIADGADAVVVGRPIRDAADPVAAARALLAELG